MAIFSGANLCMLASFFLFASFCCSFTYNGGVLVGYKYKTIRAKDWVHCFRECVSDNQCLSYNFELKKLDGHACELNSCAFKSRCEAEKVLIQTPGFVFHQLQRTEVRI